MYMYVRIYSAEHGVCVEADIYMHSLNQERYVRVGGVRIEAMAMRGATQLRYPSHV